MPAPGASWGYCIDRRYREAYPPGYGLAVGKEGDVVRGRAMPARQGEKGAAHERRQASGASFIMFVSFLIDCYPEASLVNQLNNEALAFQQRFFSPSTTMKL
jgi:hypothetical protein